MQVRISGSSAVDKSQILFKEKEPTRTRSPRVAINYELKAERGFDNSISPSGTTRSLSIVASRDVAWEGWTTPTIFFPGMTRRSCRKSRFSLSGSSEGPPKWFARTPLKTNKRNDREQQKLRTASAWESMRRPWSWIDRKDAAKLLTLGWLIACSTISKPQRHCVLLSSFFARNLSTLPTSQSLKTDRVRQKRLPGLVSRLETWKLSALSNCPRHLPGNPLSEARRIRCQI